MAYERYAETESKGLRCALILGNSTLNFNAHNLKKPRSTISTTAIV
jgi:hypothetical protein